VRIEIAMVAGLAVIFASAAARATPSARLVYSRARGAESCPDEQALRRAVAARVGYDPFFPWAKQTVVAAVAPASQGGFAATVSLVDERGVEHGLRTLRTPGKCNELVDVAALAIAIAIDPRSLMPRPAASVPGPAAPPTPTETRPMIGLPDQGVEAATGGALPPSDVAVMPPPATRIAFEGTAGVVASSGVAMSPALGGVLGAALRRGRLSLGLEGRADAPAAVSVRGISSPGNLATSKGQVSSELFAATILPCVHVWRVIACVVGQIGSEKDASTGVAGPQSHATAWWAVGGRLGVEVPLESTLGLRVHSDILADPRPRRLDLDGYPAYWTAPLVSTSLGVDAVVHF
jgi:hypothetical protein